MPEGPESAAPVSGISSFRDALQQQPAVPASGKAGGGRSRSSLSEIFLFTGDFLLWTGLFAACLLFLRGFAQGSNFPNISIFAIPLVVSLLTAWLVGGYDRNTDFQSLRFASEFLIAGMLASVFGAGLTALFGSYGSSRLASRFLLLATPFAFTIAALLMRRFLASTRGWNRQGMGRVLLLGSAAEAAALERALHLAGRPATVNHLFPGSLEELSRHLEPVSSPAGESPAADSPAGDSDQWIGTVVIGASQSVLPPGWCPFLVSLHTSRLPVYSWSSFWRQRVRMHDVHDSSTSWLFERDFRLTTSSVYWHIKRLMDLLLASLCLLLALPVLVLAAVAIRMDSPGPALFRQQRVGFRGVPFTIYKFRSMRLNSDADGTTTTPGDFRITRLGKLLRRTRVDEIPQLINVLKGDMSIVGPRPEWTVCADEYEHQLPYYHLRHLVKPGLTGWAQVNYPYGVDVADARNKLSFDLYYVMHASLVLDCTTLLKTLYVLIGRIGGH